MMELERKRRLKPFFEDIVNRRDELVRHHKVALLTNHYPLAISHSLIH